MIEYKDLDTVKIEYKDKLSVPRIERAFKAEIGAKPRFRKGKYGKKYDYYSCSNCGKIIEITANFCHGCGYRLNWDNPRCLTDYNNAKE